jgi:hypothetical protein
VTLTDGTHLDNFPVKELNAFFGSEETGFGHFENIVGREKFSGGFHAHILFSFHIANQCFSREAVKQVFARLGPLWKQFRQRLSK